MIGIGFISGAWQSLPTTCFGLSRVFLMGMTRFRHSEIVNKATREEYSIKANNVNANDEKFALAA